MHPKNIYNEEPDFKQLADMFSSFKAFVKEGSNKRCYIDFKNPLAVKELCICLMKKDFNIELDFPLDTLCPTVPNRLNYILWLNDLMNETVPARTQIKGIDIGVGASCIYPLLGCANYSHWSFLGTDINLRSLEYADKNIKKNKLESRIRLIHNKNAERIFLLDQKEYDFCICNPPFYDSQEALEEAAFNKELEPYAICTGSSNEMITNGGEYGFVSRMIYESIKLKTSVRWYTSMLGIKDSIHPLVRLLRKESVTNYLVTDLKQGNTTRWVIAWSFYPERAVKTHFLQEYHPKSLFTVQLPKSIQFVFDRLELILKDLEINYEKDRSVIFSTVKKNTWSRAARRQKKRKTLTEEISPKDLFSFTIEDIEEKADCQCTLQISWTKGEDRKVFEGFWSHIKKRVEEQCGLEKGTKSKCFIEA
ncbi:hypothetical protein BY458DRAFT_439889 [Sporodiniella umbellata]|nr:hypothetical protein BY458DRAFT_439889 [Sporodiniella umbellata]